MGDLKFVDLIKWRSNATLPRGRQIIWKHTVEKSQTNVIWGRQFDKFKFRSKATLGRGRQSISLSYQQPQLVSTNLFGSYKLFQWDLICIWYRYKTRFQRHTGNATVSLYPDMTFVQSLTPAHFPNVNSNILNLKYDIFGVSIQRIGIRSQV